MDLEDAIKQQLAAAENKKRPRSSKSANLPERLTPPSAVRAIRGDQLNKRDRAGGRGMKLTAAELRIRQLMSIDKKAQRAQRLTERKVKADYLKQSKSIMPAGERRVPHGNISLYREIRSVARGIGSAHSLPSPGQVRGGYVGRYNPETSAVATGSMGSLINGLKPQGLTALFNTAVDRGRKKTSDSARELFDKVKAGIRQLANKISPNRQGDKPRGKDQNKGNARQKSPAAERAIGRRLGGDTRPVRSAGPSKTSAPLPKVAERGSSYFAMSALHSMIHSRNSRYRDDDGGGGGHSHG